MFLFACDCQEFPFGSLGEETSINDTEEHLKEHIDKLYFSMF